VILLLMCSSAYAFDDPSQFSPMLSATTSASSEGLYFTGAPRGAGLECSSCHLDAAGKIDIKIGANPADLFATGWQPNTQYEIEIELLDEQQGLPFNTPDGTCTEPGTKMNYVQCNNNNFSLEIDADNGPIGTLCAEASCASDPFSDEVQISSDKTAALANRRHDKTRPSVVTNNGETHWHLWWTSPGAGAGPLTLYVATVDGNGGAGTIANDQDPSGDDTVSAVVSIAEAGVPVVTGPRAGCGLSPVDAPGQPMSTRGGIHVVAILLLTSEILRRRRRRAGRAGAARL
jgi:hypothetical protein